MPSTKDQSRKRKLELDSHDEASQAPKRANKDSSSRKKGKQSHRELQAAPSTPPSTPPSSPEVWLRRVAGGDGRGWSGISAKLILSLLCLCMAGIDTYTDFTARGWFVTVVVGCGCGCGDSGDGDGDGWEIHTK